MVRLAVVGGFVVAACPSVTQAVDFGTVVSSSFQTETFLLNFNPGSTNPYDVDAWATFVHRATGKQITTGIYYDGGTDYRFRFTGTLPGTWDLTTTGPGSLAGSIGTIDVAFDPQARGFLATSGTHYARMMGSEDQLKAQPYVVYMNRRSETASPNPGFGDDLGLISSWSGPANASRRAEYIQQAKANGANAIFLHLNNQWLQDGAEGWDDHHSTTPDRGVFQAIEDLIVDAHAEDVQVHIWAWGDNETRRRATPIGLPGGINGSTDKRIQRYIADRLGPLPGWSMGYGFDLYQWVNIFELSEWGNFLNDRSGWDHVLSARGFKFLDANNSLQNVAYNLTNSYASFSNSNNVLQTEGGPAGTELEFEGGPYSYAEILQQVQSAQDRPTIYEERHAYRRYENHSLHDLWPTTTMDGTRRLLWWWSMAGGAAGIIGFYPEGTNVSHSGPYPHPEQLRTHLAFWEKWSTLDMTPDNGLTGGVEESQYAMRSDGEGTLVIFAESTQSITLNLSEFDHAFSGHLIDTQDEYVEIDLGILQPLNQMLDLSSYGVARDWALVLVPHATLAGDYNGDGVVNLADYTVWRDRLSGGTLVNETTTPGSVDLADYLVWKSSFATAGAITAKHVFTAVPEPSACLSMFVFVALTNLFKLRYPCYE